MTFPIISTPRLLLSPIASTSNALLSFITNGAFVGDVNYPLSLLNGSSFLFAIFGRFLSLIRDVSLLFIVSGNSSLSFISFADSQILFLLYTPSLACYFSLPFLPLVLFFLSSLSISLSYNLTSFNGKRLFNHSSIYNT